MSVVRALLVAASAVLLSLTELPAQPTMTLLGPMRVGHFERLKQNLGVKPNAPQESYYTNGIYNNVMNILIDSIRQSSGTEFCLPAAWAQWPEGRVFAVMVEFVDKALENASAEADLRDTIIGHLKSELPCHSG